MSRGEYYSAKYHREAITVFFNSADNPEWDNELIYNIRNAGYTKEKALAVMKGIVFVEGHNILVDRIYSDGDVDELIEIMELHFSLRRNMSRGTRIPTAGISLDDLLGGNEHEGETYLGKGRYKSRYLSEE